jgi:branched-chain amino acid transport system permease protein
MESGFREQRLTTPRLGHLCRVHGDADGLPMLLVHGNFASSRWWEPFLAILPDALHAVAPDLRGCGGAGKPDSGYTIADLAEDLRAILDVLGWDEFDLVGHGSGGAVSVELALRDPHRVRTLTLVDSAPLEGVYSPVEILRLLDLMRSDADLLRQALAALMPTYAGATAADAGYDSLFFDSLVEDAQNMAPAAFTEVAADLNRWNRFADAATLTMPCLVVWGSLDVIVDRDAATRTLLGLPGAQNLEVLRNVGHSPMIEAPVTLAERLIEFITDDLDAYAEAREMAD